MRITRDHIIRTRDTHYYIYSDDRTRKSYRGQAEECNGLSNAFAVTTKWWCCNDTRAFFKDHEFELLILPKWTDEFQWITDNANGRIPIILPKIGCGRAELPIRAPKTYAYLLEQLRKIDPTYMT